MKNGVLDINKKESYLKQQVKRALKANKLHKALQLITTAIELGLFRDIALEEIKFRKKELAQKKKLDVTEEFNRLPIQVEA